MSFNLNRKTEYALVALARLAEGAADRDPVSARQIAEGYELPVPVMTNVMKALQRAGLIDSVRGAGGGYLLARAPQRITLAAVIECIEGPVHLTLCCEDEAEGHGHAHAQGHASNQPNGHATDDPDDPDGDEPCAACRVLRNCAITDSMRAFNDLVVDMLNRITLSDLVAGRLKLSITVPTRSPRPKAAATA